MTSESSQAGGNADERSQLLAADPGAGGQLVVRFYWHMDRFVHRVEALLDAAADGPLAADRRVVVLAEPLAESPDATAWPVNPPLQQLDSCTLAAGRRGLVGVGMAGRSHWSLAVEARDQQLWFDVACRIQQAPERLQSSYVFAEPSSPRWTESDPTRLAVPLYADAGLASSGSHGGSVQLCPDPEWTELVRDADPRRVHLRPRQIPQRLPATVRWRYGFVATA